MHICNTNLTKSEFKGPTGPVVLAIMAGVGIGKYQEGDAVRSALKPHLDGLPGTRSLPG